MGRKAFFLVASVSLAFCAGHSKADIIYIADTPSGQVGEYNASTGAPINANLVSGVTDPIGVAVDGSGNLYVGNYNPATVGVYSVTNGTVSSSNANLVTGISPIGPYGIAVDSSGHLFVANYTSGVIGEYNASTGAAINANLITGLDGPYAIAVDGAGHLYVSSGAGSNRLVGEYTVSNGLVGSSNSNLITSTNPLLGLAVDNSGNLYVSSDVSGGGGAIGKYAVSDGGVLSGNANFITGVNQAQGLALDSSGSDLYVSINSGHTIAEYNANTGDLINNSLISVNGAAAFVAVTSVPEPRGLILLGTTSAIIFCGWQWGRRRQPARISA